jgi:hypothetical protein
MAVMNYEDLVKQAEQAVGPVKDPELRRIAFEKILDALLESPTRERHAQTTTRRTKTKKADVTGARDTQIANKKRRGTAGYVEELIDEQFFAKPKTITAVKAELANRGHHIPLTALSGPLQRLCQRKRLRREKAPSADGGKKAFAYSNW